jgi:hypothetical protein
LFLWEAALLPPWEGCHCVMGRLKHLILDLLRDGERSLKEPCQKLFGP